jgi:hypothetical protein
VGLARRHLPFLGLWVAAAALRLALLLTSQSHVSGDEGVVGIMARHIATRGEVPIYFHGQVYSGGSAIMAVLATVPLAIFGVGPVPLKLAAVVVSLAVLAATYAYGVRHLGRRTALVAALLLATATPLVEWHGRITGAYGLLLLFEILLLDAYQRIAASPRPGGRQLLLFGLLAGLSWYNFELIAPVLAVLGLALLGQAWRGRIGPAGVGLAALGALVGAAPAIAFNLIHDFANLALVFGAGAAEPGAALARLREAPLRLIPAFFTVHNGHRFADPLPPTAYLESGIRFALLAGVALTAFRRRRDPARLLVSVVLASVVAYLLSSGAALSPRYLMPVYPALALVVALGLVWLASAGRYRPALSLALGGTLVGLGLASHLRSLGPARVVTDVYLAGGLVENRPTSGSAVPRILRHLRERGVRHVRCDYFLQWQLLFESDESILASSAGFVPGAAFPEYDERVLADPRPAFVFHRDSDLLRQFLERPGAADFDAETIAEFRVFTPTARR